MLRQTKQWSKMLTHSGQAINIFEIDGIFIEKRKITLGEYGLFIIGLEKEISFSTEEKLINLCKLEKSTFIQIETLFYNNLKDLELKYLKKGYYKKFITPYTALIKLEQSEEDILKNMKPKGRYNIKLATKKGVEVKIVNKTDENIEKFYDLIIETTSRDGFSGNNFEYYKIFLEYIDSSELIIAYKDEKVIAAGIFVFNKDLSIYYYGASTSNSEYRNLMAPYLIQWKAILEAKKRGSEMYDFLGVASPGDKDSALTGVTDFKLKLTSDFRLVSESYIYVNKKFKYNLIKILRKLKNI